jgi:lipopolysaccharide transport system permease protein
MSAEDVADQNMEALVAPIHYVKATKGWASLNLLEIWEYRELLYFLIWRDIKVRYKQTILGGLWAIIQPVSTMLVFTLFFGTLANMPSDEIPYPLFSFSALVPWTYFANSLGQASNSLVGNANLITKVYFPRLVIPIAAVLSGLVDFLLAFLVLLVMMIGYKYQPGVGILWLPFFLLLVVITSLGIGLWLSAMNVQFRDVRYLIPFITQFWLFITPIAYPSSLLPASLRPLYGLNPMAGAIEGFRWALLGVETKPGPIIAVSALTAFTLLVSGALYFRRTEKIFADVV